MTRSPRKRAVALARELGAVIETHESEADREIQIGAPDGYVWSATETHWIVGSQFKPFGLAPVWASLFEDMRAGVEPCTLEDCDICLDT